MEAAEELTCGHLLGDISDAGVGRLYGRHIIGSETLTGNHLRDKDKQQTGSENIGKPSSARNRLIERRAHDVANARALVEPAIEARRHFLAGCLHPWSSRRHLAQHFLVDNVLPEILEPDQELTVFNLVRKRVHIAR